MRTIPSYSDVVFVLPSSCSNFSWQALIFWLQSLWKKSCIKKFAKQRFSEKEFGEMPLFSGTDLVLYFFFYGFMAWIIATIFVSLKEQGYRNFGILNLPILVQPAIMMIFLIILSSGKNVSTSGLLFMTFLYGIFVNKIALFFLHKFYQNKNNSLRIRDSKVIPTRFL